MGSTVAGAIAASAALVAALAGIVQLGRWRVTGESPAGWIAAGLLTYSGAALAVPGVAILISPEAASSRSGVALLRPVAVPVVLALFATAAGMTGCADRRRTLRMAGLCGAVGLVAALAVAWIPTARSILGPSLVSGPASGVASTGQLVVAAGWCGLAVAFARRNRRAGDAGGWMVVMLVALGASRLSLSLGGGVDSVSVAASQAFRIAAVLAALAGALRGLVSLASTLRHELVMTRVELGRERGHLQDVEARDGSRRHQLRNGLAAIGGTAWLLEHHDRNLDEPTRTQLIEGVTGEVRRLQRLLEPAHTTEER